MNLDVLLFVDNIFRFTQANSEVSALLGRIPAAVGYQPTLAEDLGIGAFLNAGGYLVQNLARSLEFSLHP